MGEGKHHNVNVHRVIDALEVLSDASEQRRLWLSSGHGGAEVGSLVEAVEALFTDSGLSDELERTWRAERGGNTFLGPRNPIFDIRIDSLLERLEWLVTKVDRSLPPEALIQSPEMGAVRVQASELQEALALLRKQSR